MVGETGNIEDEDENKEEEGNDAEQGEGKGEEPSIIICGGWVDGGVRFTVERGLGTRVVLVDTDVNSLLGNVLTFRLILTGSSSSGSDIKLNASMR